MQGALPDILERTRVRFGKHKNSTWAVVVRKHPSYVKWWLTTDNPAKIGIDVLKALEKAIGATVTSSIRARSDRETPYRLNAKLSPMPVEWQESGDRREFFAEYEAVGAIPGILLGGLSRSSRNNFAGSADRTGREVSGEAPSFVMLRKVLSQSVFLVKRDRPGVHLGVVRFAASLLEKLLTRGQTPLPTLGIEREAFRLHGPFNFVREFGDEDPEVGWESDLEVDPVAILSAAIDRDRFMLDAAFDLAPTVILRSLGVKLRRSSSMNGYQIIWDRRLVTGSFRRHRLGCFLNQWVLRDQVPRPSPRTV